MPLARSERLGETRCSRRWIGFRPMHEIRHHHITLDLAGRPVAQELSAAVVDPKPQRLIRWRLIGDIDADEATATAQAAQKWLQATRPSGVSNLIGQTLTLDRLGTAEMRRASQAIPRYGATAPVAALDALARLNEARTRRAQQIAVDQFCDAYAVSALREVRPSVLVRLGPDPEASRSLVCPDHCVKVQPTLYRHLPDGQTAKPAMTILADLVHLVAHVIDVEWLVPGEPVHDLGFLRRSTHMFRSLGVPQMRPPRRQWFHVVAGNRDAGTTVRGEREPRSTHLSIVRRGERR